MFVKENGAKCLANIFYSNLSHTPKRFAVRVIHTLSGFRRFLSFKEVGDINFKIANLHAQMRNDGIAQVLINFTQESYGRSLENAKLCLQSIYRLLSSVTENGTVNQSFPC